MLSFLKTLGVCVESKRCDYYSFPLWIEEDKQTKKVRVVGFNELPLDVQQLISYNDEKQDFDEE